MSRVSATTTAEGETSPDDWRPVPTDSLASREKAEFLANWGKDEPANDETPKPKAKGAVRAETVDEDDEDDSDVDDDDDLDDDEDEDAEDEQPAKPTKAKEPPPEKDEDDEDPDADLEDDEEDEDKPDPAVARGMAKLQKQEQRMRQQFDRRMEQVLEREKAAEAAKAKYDRLMERVNADPVGVLEELGLKDVEFAAKQAYIRTKAASDPQYKELAARELREREMKEKLSGLEKKLAEREKAEAEERAVAEQKRQVETLLEGIGKIAPKVDKAPLTQLALKNDPNYARGLFAQAYMALSERDGSEPSPRKVVLVAEKMQRAALRRYGIDPKTLVKAGAANANETKAASSGKRTNGKAVRAPDDDDLAFPSRDQLLAEEWSR